MSAKIRTPDESLDRLRLVVDRMGRAELTERDAVRCRLSLGPTKEQKEYTRGMANGLDLARSLLLQLAKDAAAERDAAASFSAHTDSDTTLGQHRGATSALLDAYRALGLVAGSTP